MKRLIVGFVTITVMFLLLPCTAWTNPCCNGDYDCNGDVDISDYILFAQDFMRGFLGIPPIEPCNAGVISKTGQTTSYATGDDGDLQKGVPWPNPRFTDNGNGTVTDNLTGLIWMKDASCRAEVEWEGALWQCSKRANGTCQLTDGSIAGDWRLPNYKELLSLIDFENAMPALPSENPFINVSLDYYYATSTYCYANSDTAWVIDMNFGKNACRIHDNDCYVWCVRDPL